jgi:hypothetical protein
LSTPSPEKLLEDIKSWTTKKGKLTIEPYDNPNAHFSIWVSPLEPHVIIPIMVAYPKGDNRILMGWNWKPEDSNIKAYAAIKDRRRKESIMRAVQGECITRGFTLGVEPPDIDHLEQMAITRSLPVNDLTRDRYGNTLWNLMYMWGFLMSQFERHDMSRAGFNPADYI